MQGGRFEAYALAVATNGELPASDTAQRCAELGDKWIQIGGTFVATLVIEGTIDGEHWA